MKRLRNIIGMLVVGGALFSGIMIVPWYFANYQFQDDLYTIARFADNKSDDALREEAAKKATSHDLPLEARDIKITHDGSQITMTADYTITVDLRFREVTLEFHADSRKP